MVSQSPLSAKSARLWLWVAAGILGWLFVLTRCWRNPYADLVLRNGVVYTGNPSKPNAEAVAIRGDRILLVGKNQDVDRFIGSRTQVRDLKGRFVCAGFNDAHVHLTSGGKVSTELDLGGLTTIEEIQSRILKKVWTLPPGTWLVGRGWDQSLFAGGAWPNKRMLDIIAPDVPILLFRVCGHAALVNSKALSIAGIATGIPNPPSGEIVRDPSSGEPTGILKEEAIKLVSQYIPTLSREGMEQAVLNALDALRKYGITSVQDDSPEEVISVYEKFLAAGRLTCRISLWHPLNANPERYNRTLNRFRRPYLQFGLLKAVLDGSAGARTAFFMKPYDDDTTTRGISLLTQEELNLLVLRADRSGFQIGLQAIGDEANRMALTAFALARQVNGARDLRHRIEHAQVLSERDLPRLAELGIVASMQPVHCIEDIRWIEACIGSARSRYAYAWRSLLKSGTVLAFGSDWPYAPLNPIVGIYAAVTRRDTLGQPSAGFVPQERITVQEAIDAYTKGSAYAERMENEKGTIEKDKLADLVVLDQNLLGIPPRQILKTLVTMTVCAGKIVYESR